MSYVGCYTWGNRTFRQMNAKVNSLRENLPLAFENLKSEARVASVVGARVIRRSKLKQCAKARTHAVQTHDGKERAPTYALLLLELLGGLPPGSRHVLCGFAVNLTGHVTARAEGSNSFSRGGFARIQQLKYTPTNMTTFSHPTSVLHL